MPFGYNQTPCTRTANEASEPINKLLKGTKSHELALKAVGGYPCQSNSALINDELSDITLPITEVCMMDHPSVSVSRI